MRVRRLLSNEVVASLLALMAACTSACATGASGGDDGTGAETGDAGVGDDVDGSGDDADSSGGDVHISGDVLDTPGDDLHISGDVLDTSGDDADATGSDSDAAESSVDAMAGDVDADTGAADTAPIDVGPTDCTVDSDADGLFDEQEGRFAAPAVDTDKDGTPDYLDTDSDNDGIPDAVEYVVHGCGAAVLTAGANDADGDALSNWRDLDSDANGLIDHDEACPPASMPGSPAGCTRATPADFDRDGVMDFLDPDNDHDAPVTDLTVGLEDVHELTDFAGAYVGLVDSDGDLVPDLWDRDSDGDHILDLVDGLGDPDKDLVANFRDVDSDGDTVMDWCEARANPAPTSADDLLPILDTNGDGKPDYLQKDTDGDLLVDGKEDQNGNCVVDATETDRLKADTDGDGVSDLIEVTLVDVACAKSAACTPAKSKKFYFIVPYSPDGSLKPSPTDSLLALSTALNQGDVAFAIDSTTSMDGIESNLSSSIATRIIPGLSGAIPDLQLGVIGYDDALLSPYGGSAATATHSADKFVWFPNGGDPSKGSWLTSSTSDATNAAFGLSSTKTSIGGDYPEGTTPAMWWMLTGDLMTFGASGRTFPAATGLASDRFGGVHFRKSALPIVINATDANFHNGITTGCGGLTPCASIAYGTGDASASSLGHSPLLGELKDKFVALGAKYIGVSVHGGSTGASTGINRDATTLNRYGSTVDMLYLARNTGSKAPPSALSGTASDCKTEDPAATVKNPADGDGLCPLVFDLQYSGSGLGDVVVSGVVALLKAITFDVHVAAYNDAAETTDVVTNFVLKVEPQPTGGTDPVTGGTCVSFPASQLADAFVGPKALTAGTDGVNDTIKALNPGSLYCFDVVPKPNTAIVAKADPQIFRAWLSVIAAKPSGGTYLLGADREVIFLVPPIVN